MMNASMPKSYGSSGLLIAAACLLLLLSFGYLSGILSGRLPKRSVLVFIYAARAAVITLFLLIPFSLISVLMFSAFIGFLWLAAENS